MGLTRCLACESIEGKIVYPEKETDEFEIECGECGTQDEIEFIPEHDDFDMER